MALQAGPALSSRSSESRPCPWLQSNVHRGASEVRQQGSPREVAGMLLTHFLRETACKETLCSEYKSHHLEESVVCFTKSMLVTTKHVPRASLATGPRREETVPPGEGVSAAHSSQDTAGAEGGAPGGTYSDLLGVVLIDPSGLHLGIVHGQVPAVPLAQREAPAAHHGLLLRGHGLQRGQDRAAALPRPLLVHAQVQRAVLVHLHVRVLSAERQVTALFPPTAARLQPAQMHKRNCSPSHVHTPQARELKWALHPSLLPRLPGMHTCVLSLVYPYIHTPILPIYVPIYHLFVYHLSTYPCLSSIDHTYYLPTSSFLPVHLCFWKNQTRA